MGKGRFRAFDAFQKTVEEARIKTASGGLVTLVSACIIFLLVILEVWDWRRVVIRNELIVDKTRGILHSPFSLFCMSSKCNIDYRRSTGYSNEYYISAYTVWKFVPL